MFNVPSHNELQKIVELIRSIIFPDFFPTTTQPEPLLKALMLIQLSTVIDDTEEAKRITKEFCNKMPEIRALERWMSMLPCTTTLLYRAVRRLSIAIRSSE